MKIRILSLGIVALTLTAGSTAYADVHFNVDVNPFGWGAPPPPVVYESPRYYAPPPVVYYGRGRWGEHRDGRGRGRDHDRGRSGHHDGGDDRR
jgi:hypothetical protein